MKLIKRVILFILIFICFIPATNSNYLDQETSNSNTFSAGCWSPPSIPVLLTPANNSATNSADIVLDWSDSSFVCPNQSVEYQFQWDGVDSVWQSASDTTIIAPSEGTYSWKVRARDSQGYISDYSAAWTIIIDRTPPNTYLDFNGYEINETVINGGFELGSTGWSSSGKVIYTSGDAYTDPYDGSYMVRIGHRTAVTGKEIWENKLTQPLPSGAKNLSFYYNFFSFDDTFDNPGIVVRLNDYNVFYLSADDIDNLDSPNSSGWTQLSFDISQITDPVLEIIFYSGNTDDLFSQSWVYIDNVSTSEAVAVDSSPFSLTSADNLSGVANTYYSLDGGATFIPSTSFDLNTITGEVEVYYYSVDYAGNQEGFNTRRLVKDTQPPAAITDLSALATSKQTVELSWTVPNDLPSNISPTAYDIRYSLAPITTDALFTAATQVPNSPAPRLVSQTQIFEVSGLDSAADYYFAIKSTDAALNWSALSNSANDTTLNVTTEDPAVNSGDVVINELMWSGTSLSGKDEYLELRNMTDQTIDLSGWQLTKNTDSGEAWMYTIPAGTNLAPHDYLLISEYDQDHSKINVDPDLIVGAGNTNDADFALRNKKLQIKLYNGDWTASSLIDVADNALGQPAAGQLNSADSIYYSMERDATPGDGTQASSWHTIFDDSAAMHAYWDIGAFEKGTPGGPNLSQLPSEPADLLPVDPLTPLSEPLPQPISTNLPTLEQATPSAQLQEPEATPSAILIIEPEKPVELPSVATDSAKPNHETN